ncbi:MAG: nickel-dependent hydrogenase large subunit [Dehalococcoidales bacterium]|nr:MAG: nickel-dependent hydrogenase large subunit [Dehalococcoidales bacterium]
MGKIIIDPVTRIEGHLKIEAVTENGVVKETRSTGSLFRGIELILRGRDPRDAQRYVQRICGVCPTSHSMAATLNLDSAFGVDGKIPDNGRLLRNLILGAAHLADHILHFYHLCALDYVDVTKVVKYEGNNSALNSVKAFIQRGELGPFVPRYEGDYRLPDEIDQQAVAHYVQALEIRRKGQEMLSIFGGKMPHNCAIMPGGVTEVPTVDKIASFLWRLNEIRDFIDNVYIPDVLAVAGVYSDYFEIGQGCGNLLSYGSFDLETSETDLTKRQRLLKQGTVSTDLKLGEVDTSKITEAVKHSWYDDSTGGLHPSHGDTRPQPGKEGAYSWLKSPRYGGKVYEVGPLARVAVTYVAGNPTVKTLVDSVLSHFNAPPAALFSVLGRHAARALYTKLVADTMPEWLLQLKPGEPVYVDYEIPDESTGMGLVDAARGALGHWVEIKDQKIANYQCVVPSTWNFSPRDNDGQPGPVEQAITGTKIKDESNPVEIVRIVRSMDPCIACAVHLVTPKGRDLGEFRIC